MAGPSLLVYPDNERGQFFWAFDHATDHANLAQGTTDPSAYNLANWQLDPILGANIASGNWNNDHQGSHDDLASYYNQPPSLRFSPGQPGDAWWTFTNSWEHSALNGAMLESQG